MKIPIFYYLFSRRGKKCTRIPNSYHLHIRLHEFFMRRFHFSGGGIQNGVGVQFFGGGGGGGFEKKFSDTPFGICHVVCGRHLLERSRDLKWGEGKKKKRQ